MRENVTLWNHTKDLLVFLRSQSVQISRPLLLATSFFVTWFLFSWAFFWVDGIARGKKEDFEAERIKWNNNSSSSSSSFPSSFNSSCQGLLGRSSFCSLKYTDKSNHRFFPSFQTWVEGKKSLLLDRNRQKKRLFLVSGFAPTQGYYNV